MFLIGNCLHRYEDMVVISCHSTITDQIDDTIRHRIISQFKILILNMALTDINDGNHSFTTVCCNTIIIILNDLT